MAKVARMSTDGSDKKHKIFLYKIVFLPASTTRGVESLTLSNLQVPHLTFHGGRREALLNTQDSRAIIVKNGTKFGTDR